MLITDFSAIVLQINTHFSSLLQSALFWIGIFFVSSKFDFDFRRAKLS